MSWLTSIGAWCNGSISALGGQFGKVMYYVYVLKNKFGWTYVGQTNNIEDRLRRHNSGLVKSTKSRIPLNIVHQETFETRTESMKREKSLKSGQGREWIKKMCW